MEYIRRRSLRHRFGGAAEISDIKSKKRVLALTTDLSAFGCFIQTETPLPRGTEVAIRITHKGNAFVGFGRVVHAQPTLGMGIAFRSVTQEDQMTLDRWLSDSAPSRRQPMLFLNGIT